MFLSCSEIERLTGYRRPSAQLRWLQRHGWRATVNALGQPVVAIGEFNRHMVGGRTTAQEPNWGAMNGPPAKTR